MMLKALQRMEEPSWVLSHQGYNVLTERAVESRFAFGNGFLDMRAARSISRGRALGCVAGIYQMGLLATLLTGNAGRRRGDGDADRRHHGQTGSGRDARGVGVATNPAVPREHLHKAQQRRQRLPRVSSLGWR